VTAPRRRAGKGATLSDETPTAPAARLQPSASYSFSMRLHAPQQGGAFARVAQAIADADAMPGAIDLVRVESREVVRDVTVACADSGHAEAVVRAVRGLEGVRVDSVSDRTFLMHKGGKIEVNAKLPLKTRDDLSMAYTPGVARVSMAIHEDPAKAWALTIKANTVAVVSDGTAVLGLGDIGPGAAMPVMEGKAMLFKEFAGVDAFSRRHGQLARGRDTTLAVIQRHHPVLRIHTRDLPRRLHEHSHPLTRMARAVGGPNRPPAAPRSAATESGESFAVLDTAAPEGPLRRTLRDGCGRLRPDPGRARCGRAASVRAARRRALAFGGGRVRLRLGRCACEVRSGTQRQECLTPRVSATIDDYPS
jgi:hypothetical protein